MRKRIFFSKMLACNLHIVDLLEGLKEINDLAWIKAPTIGHFAMYKHGDSIYGSNYESPVGARIIRINNTED